MEKQITLGNGVSGAALVAGSGTNLFVSEDMVSMLRKSLQDEGRSEIHMVATFDLLGAAGWAWTDCVPNTKRFEGQSTQTPEKRERLFTMWKGAQTKAVQTLLALPAAAAAGQVAAGWDKMAYTDKGKPKDRAHWQGAMADAVTGLGLRWRDHLDREENRKNFLRHQELIAAGDVEGAAALAALLPDNQPKTRLTPSEFLDEKLTETITKTEKAKGDSVDLVALRELVLRFRSELRTLRKASQAAAQAAADAAMASGSAE